MKLEFKHLAGYLPYGLKIEHPTMLAGKRKISELRNLGQTNIEISHRLYVQISNCKPILHPLSDLTKEIEFNSEKFVPIDKIKSMWGYETFEYQGYINYAHYFKLNDNEPAILHLPYCFIELFLEWHFDIYDLINNGLAIDINSL